MLELFSWYHPFLCPFYKQRRVSVVQIRECASPSDCWNSGALADEGGLSPEVAEGH